MSSNAPSSFEDRGEARLILDLESAIANSPRFDLNLFRSSLESKDMYGNEQVSRQHVIQGTYTILCVDIVKVDPLLVRKISKRHF